ncbi:unnamed protein product [Eruca vesicaria subsp. sativa]|uniref:DNA polymerase alpha/delta/epsilon subunit B domain-containing protein n=1 Tax=Eruca vesicaria subsp. sativa TaxID=29727 RepID=A0ABC8JL55_ERUVS|nr:unnamed protein product [Eruca vesicaria subsp. sativa]
MSFCHVTVLIETTFLDICMSFSRYNFRCDLVTRHYLSSHRSVAFSPDNTFRSCRNPHSFDVDDVRFLGTYGTNINDLDKYSEAKSKLDFAKRTQRWRHLAPTALNTLSENSPFPLQNIHFEQSQAMYL